MKKIFLTLPLIFSLECQASKIPSLEQTQEMMHHAAETQQQQQESVSSYIPREVDVQRFLRVESKCYFGIGRCFLQPVNIIAPLVASALMVASNVCRESSETASNVLGWTASGLSVLGFLSGVFLAKINDKLQGIDDFIRRQEIEERANAMVAERMVPAEAKQHFPHADNPAVASELPASI